MLTRSLQPGRFPSNFQISRSLPTEPNNNPTMHIRTLALAALAAAASAENLRFTRISQPGLSRRDADAAYSPQETECGEGDTCAEACGTGFEECQSSGGVSSCYNPEAGETCCSDLGSGSKSHPS